MTDEVSVLRELGERLAPNDLQPPAMLRARVLGSALASPVAPSWYRRHARPLALLAAACATGALALSPQLLDRPGGRAGGLTPATSSPASSAAKKDCSAGSSRALTAHEVADLLFLPPESLSGPMRDRPIYSLDLPNCAAATQGGEWFTQDRHGRVIKRFTLMGPDQRDYYSQPNSPEFGGEGPIAVQVNGRPGTLYYAADVFGGMGRLFWSTPDGRHWAAEGYGMTQEQVLAAARTVIRDGKVTSGAPAGLQHATPSVGTSPGSAAANTEANFDFGPLVMNKESKLQLRVSVAGRFAGMAGIGSRPIDINGATGWLSDIPGGHDLLWSPRPGILLELTARYSLTKTLQIARATVKVTPDNPRLH